MVCFYFGLNSGPQTTTSQKPVWFLGKDVAASVVTFNCSMVAQGEWVEVGHGSGLVESYCYQLRLVVYPIISEASIVVIVE